MRRVSWCSETTMRDSGGGYAGTELGGGVEVGPETGYVIIYIHCTAPYLHLHNIPPASRYGPSQKTGMSYVPLRLLSSRQLLPSITW